MSNSKNFNYSDYELHSREMKEIITKVPSWIVRWGLTVFLCVLLLIIMLSNAIVYPEYIHVPFTLKVSNPVRPIHSRVSGKISQILVKENQTVSSGQPLAFIDSKGDPNQLIELLPELKLLRQRIISKSTIDTYSLNSLDLDKLGRLESQFHQFFIHYQDWLDCRIDGSVNSELDKQVSMSELGRMQVGIQNLNKCEIEFLLSLNSFVKDIESWIARFVITSDFSGRTKFVKMLQINENIHNGEKIFYIEPISSEIYGEMKIPSNVRSQISVGQEMTIKLTDSLFERFGVLKGNIVFISDVPKDNSHLVRVNFDRTRRFIDENRMYLKPEVIGDAQISIKNESVFQRMTEYIF